jgi:triacylglycerol lipase
LATERLVFLVPGFFGFTSAGAVSYFHDVERALARALSRRRIEARIIRCRTQPTASITRRADSLRKQVIEQGGLDADELHFVGHSTGGLDVRMLLTPGVRIAAGHSEEQIAKRTRAAITVATPHYGTPLANHFVTVQGHTLLLVMSALATSSPGRAAIVASAKALGTVASLDGWFGSAETTLDRAASGLLQSVRLDPSSGLWRYLEEIASDQGAVLQLTPEVTNLFDAAVTDREGIAYGCVIAGVRRPRNALSAKSLLDPGDAALRALFRLLYALTSREHPRYPYPRPGRAAAGRLERDFGFAVTPAVNDGVVPTLSQLHGRVLHVARGDHLDVVGHFTQASDTSNWLPSGAGFTPSDFERTWNAVAAAIAKASRAAPRRPKTPARSKSRKRRR